MRKLYISFLMAFCFCAFTNKATAADLMRITNFTTSDSNGGAVFRDESVGNGDNTSISIQSSNFNHAAFNYTVNNLNANQIYEATVDIKGENIIAEDGSGLGAVIDANTWYTSIQSTTGSYGWRKVRFVFQTDDSGNSNLRLQLGHWGRLAKGKVYFDNFEIKPFSGKQFSGGKIRLDIDTEDCIISDSKIQSYVNDLGQVYTKYQELTGHAPYNGSTVDIVFSDYHYAYGLASNPISINKRFAQDILSRFGTNNDYDFGVLHEIGHVFDQDKWNFHAEFWANTKMAYVLEELNLSVNMGGVKRIGADIKNYYKGAYENELKQGKMSFDGVTYIFLQIKDKYGWDIFKTVFRSSLPPNNGNNCKKFLSFIEALSQVSGVDIRQEFFPDSIWDLILNDLMPELSGACGDNLTWAFSPDGTLTISGTGAMQDWIYNHTTLPWYSVKDEITNVIISNGVTTIGNSAFLDCISLVSVNIPSGITKIGDHSFQNCNKLTSVTIPSSVTSIGDWAFYQCAGLTSVTNLATPPQNINSNVFGNVNIRAIPLTVPAASIAQYKAANIWKDFFSITPTAIEKIETSHFTVFPNPAKDELFIQSEQPIERVVILDIAGRTVETRHATSLQNGVQIINVSHLPKGIYIARIFVGNQEITKKIIKE
jgi:hypothetical protein